MYKSTIQQIILFIITSIIIFRTGEYMIQINGIKSVLDFVIGLLFFISTILFINYLARLASKIIGLF
ncbi:hypothetical protein BW723_10665 [Polaribacter reichenbachii]|uniref:Uncharacterized protein n=1 Tax=Polaribacter reichenbachii TaxID=996801 RepID=A0A1B8TQ60_9FLAO|nr:hypothetical protein [Polaribacter reichenbachii]APZ46718.1 hypothetical protein BW723_10665 [Polaribacter reichenbachii]AUC17361.1 hypothetical protein BTO17_01110 [Polaribacter reichenbachii]OBY61763.1 hypothetical protein LPB301_17090 [Polaribacter reichenbachii]